MDIEKATLGQLLYIARFTEHQIEAQEELKRRIIEEYELRENVTNAERVR